jgi:hypothetical protein
MQAHHKVSLFLTKIFKSRRVWLLIWQETRGRSVFMSSKMTADLLTLTYMQLDILVIVDQLLIMLIDSFMLKSNYRVFVNCITASNKTYTLNL